MCCKGKGINTLCETCWKVIQHNCGCPVKFITFCTCAKPKEMT